MQTCRCHQFCAVPHTLGRFDHDLIAAFVDRHRLLPEREFATVAHDEPGQGLAEARIVRDTRFPEVARSQSPYFSFACRDGSRPPSSQRQSVILSTRGQGP